MRKWICIGVLGGLLEFGFVWQIAFSDSDTPPPVPATATSNTGAPKNPAPSVPTNGADKDRAALAAASAGMAATSAQKTLHLAQVLALQSTPPEPEPAPEVVVERVAPPPPVIASSLSVPEMIRRVFGPNGDKAVDVARCESEFRIQAQRGQFLGLFQMGANERSKYGHGTNAMAQIQAAHALFLDRGWQPWVCA